MARRAGELVTATLNERTAQEQRPRFAGHVFAEMADVVRPRDGERRRMLVESP